MTTYPTPWTVADTRSLGVYGAEAKCYETALFDKNGNQVGNSVTGTLGYTGRTRDWQQFGLVAKTRQTKEYRKPAPKPKPRSERRVVRQETYNLNGELVDLTVETRMVYWNTKGPYIKKRNGSVPIAYEDNDTMYIRIEPKDYTTYGGQTRQKWVAVTPEEWRARI